MKGIRKKNNRWYYQIYIGTVDGKPKYTERYGGRTKEECELARARALFELNDTGQVFKKSGKLFIEVIREWFESYKPSIKQGTRMIYHNIIENHLAAEPFANYKISKVTPKMLQDYICKKSETLSAGTVSTHYSCLNMALKYAVYPMQYIKSSPMEYVHMVHKADENLMGILEVEESTVETVTMQEYKDIRAVFPENYRIILDICLYTGCRIGEALALTWDDVDFVSKTVRISKSMNRNNELKIWELSTTKTKDRRELAVSDTLIKLLKEQRTRQKEDKLAHGPAYLTPYIRFINVGGEDHIEITADETGMPFKAICTHEYGMPINSWDANSMIAKLERRHLLKDFHFHMLRHTHATMLLTNGTPIKDVQERLGHRKITTTMDTYAHTTKDSRRAAADLFDKISTM